MGSASSLPASRSQQTDSSTDSLPLAEDRLCNRVSGLLLKTRENVAVSVERDAYRRMTKALTDDLGVDTLSESDGGMRVPE